MLNHDLAQGLLNTQSGIDRLKTWSSILFARLVLLSVLCLAGCGVGPQPIPALDVSSVAYSESELRGESNAVSPGSGEVYVWPLFNDIPPEVVPVEADGSFSLPWMPPGPETRLQVRNGELRSPFIDIIRVGTRAMPRPVEECLSVPLELPEALGMVGVEVLIEIPVTNNCAGPVEVTGVSAPIGLEVGFGIEGLGLLLMPGETASTLLVAFTPPAAELFTERIILAFDGAVIERRAIEVFVRAE